MEPSSGAYNPYLFSPDSFLNHPDPVGSPIDGFFGDNFQLDDLITLDSAIDQTDQTFVTEPPHSLVTETPPSLVTEPPPPLDSLQSFESSSPSSFSDPAGSVDSLQAQKGKGERTKVINVLLQKRLQPPPIV